MNYKIEQVEGIGPHFGERLGAVGIHTSEDLLARCSTPEGRDAVAVATGISGAQILTWTNQVDLMRVSGIGSEFSQLLESAGVDTVKELATRNPENLVATMARVNEEKRLTRRVPSPKRVAKWIDQARQIEPALSY